MKIRIEIDENELKRLVVQEMRAKLGDMELDADKVKIEVKSKQNYKSEWETASYRAVFEQG